MKILLEGGNVIPDAKPIKKKDFPTAIKNLRKILPKQINLYPIGSAGQKEVSSDIDMLIDAKELMSVFPQKELKLSRKSLEDFFKSKNLPAARTGVSVHVGIPTGVNNEIVQVDLMAVENAKQVQSLHTHDYSDVTMKGGTLHAMWADLANMSSIPGHSSLMMSPYKGLVDRETKELITHDKDKIAKIIIGPTASASDMGNPTKMIKALKNYPEKYKMIKDKYFSENALNEAADVGRKYQHIEDLVLSHGSYGGLHAVERLRDMATTGNTIELKWDGMPVVYWGRDEKGNFMMIPKNAWQYLKTGKTQTSSGVSTVTKSPTDVAKFILGTGGGDEKARMNFAKQFASWWPYFEKISPKQGFLEGGLLFYPGTKPNGETAMPVLNKTTNTYDFQPNITKFHVPVNSDLGKKIARSKLGVAATGYYPTLGSTEEQRYPNAENLSTNDVLVQGTTVVQEPIKLNTKMLDNVEKFIKSHASKIDNYLKSKPGLSNPGAELYTYLNKNLRTEGLTNNFPAWAKANLSNKKAEMMLADKEGYVATLGAIEALSKQKNSLIRQLNKMSHNGLSQTNPEGYAQAHPGRKFKYDIPGQFIKVIDQEVWKPQQSVVRENVGNNKAVLGWGRGMGHTGHDMLVNAVIHQAEKTNAKPFFIVSRSFGKDDPIPPEMKLNLYKKKFPKYKNIFSLPTVESPNLNDVLAGLASKGYKDVTLVVGADQKEAFKYLINPAKSTGIPPYITFGLENLNVMSRQDTKAPGSDTSKSDYVEGPRATPMRQVLLDPTKTEKEQFDVWRQSMSNVLSDKEVLNMMNVAKANLQKFNAPKAKSVKIDKDAKGRKLKEFITKVKPLLNTMTNEQKVKLYNFLKESRHLIKSNKTNVTENQHKNMDYLEEK
jgi:hypothetical protein